MKDVTSSPSVNSPAKTNLLFSSWFVQNIFTVTTPQYGLLWFYYRAQISQYSVYRTCTYGQRVSKVRPIDFLICYESIRPKEALQPRRHVWIPSLSLFVSTVQSLQKQIFSSSVSYLSFIFGFFACHRWMRLPFFCFVRKVNIWIRAFLTFITNQGHRFIFNIKEGSGDLFWALKTSFCEYLCTHLWWKCIYLCKGKHKIQK